MKIIIITILFVYTQLTLDHCGNEDCIRDLINQSVNSINSSFEDNNLQIKLELVYCGLINYRESSSLEDDLDVLRTDSYIYDLRNRYQADLVSIVANSPDYAEGYAYQLKDSNDDYFDDWAFSIIQVRSLGTLVLHHEIGHNLGAAHDGEGIGNYSRAYHNSELGINTLMSQCGPRIALYSSPDIEYNGVIIGSDTENNTMAIRQSAKLVSEFRPLKKKDMGCGILGIEFILLFLLVRRVKRNEDQKRIRNS